MGEKRKRKRGAEEGSPAWEQGLHNNPNYVREVIRSLTDRAAGGDKEAAVALVGWLSRHPEMRSVVRQLDDLCTHTEAAWVKAIAGSDKLREQGIQTEVERMKAELLGENSSLLDKIIVSNLIVSHLSNQHALLAAAQPAEHTTVSAARDRRAESTQRRVLVALKTMALIRSMTARGHTAPGKIRLFSGIAAS